MALKGATESIKYVKALYLEVNEKELYKNCGLINEIDTFLFKYNFIGKFFWSWRGMPSEYKEKFI